MFSCLLQKSLVNVGTWSAEVFFRSFAIALHFKSIFQFEILILCSVNWGSSSFPQCSSSQQKSNSCQQRSENYWLPTVATQPANGAL